MLWIAIAFLVGGMGGLVCGAVMAVARQADDQPLLNRRVL